MHCSLTNAQEQAVEPDKMVEFKLQSSDDIVVFNWVVMPLFDVAQEKMTSYVSPTISYPTIAMCPATAGSSTLDQTHPVVYAKKDGPSDDQAYHHRRQARVLLLGLTCFGDHLGSQVERQGLDADRTSCLFIVFGCVGSRAVAVL
ncbi:hypothetical protein N9L68_06335 [bacterium]|nr:hypothetical protein [bacterium]